MPSWSHSSFNSIVVRLKAQTKKSLAPFHAGFNSIVVRLKVASIRSSRTACGSFNSIVVRLKGVVQVEGRVGSGFQFHSGSIKRLRNSVWTKRFSMFQFHSGSIKSREPCPASVALVRFNSIVVRLKGCKRGCFVCGSMFQFHSGSIKRKDRVLYRSSASMFQFHSGSIKSDSYALLPDLVGRFQFHSGSIKSDKNSQAVVVVNSVSIP